MLQQIEILEVGPRDGLQLEPQPISTELKLALIERLLRAGLKRVEVASFVNPKKVPQMADAEAVFAGLRRPAGVVFTGLVLNRRGLERAIAAGCHEIGMVVVASDTFSRRNQGFGTDEAIRNWLDIAAAARTAGVRAHVSISAAFGCPFEGEVAAQRVLDIARRVAAGAPTEIGFADTIGVAVPRQVKALIAEARRLLPDIPLRGHFHNTRNTGYANAHAAIEAGVSTLDASIGGIGGCPFAPAATGNIATEDLLYQLERSGIATGVSLAQLLEAAAWLERALGHPIPGLLTKAGTFPRVSASPRVSESAA
jgi:hydroxymethylglutaryl-CoA lyase